MRATVIAEGVRRIIGPHAEVDKIALGLLLASAALYSLAATIVTGIESTPAWLGLYVLAWIAYALLCARRALPGPFWLLLAALAFRMTLCWSIPWLSDDLYRYLLDGRALAAGINPYRFAPSAPEMLQLAPELARAVNHPELPTIYPPLIPLLSALAARWEIGVVGWRLLMSLFDLGTMLAVRRLFGSWRAAAVYGLCPLAIFESAANGHLEAMLLFFWVLAVERTQSGRFLTAAPYWSLALLSKYLPLAALPLWLRRRDFFGGMAVAVSLALLALWPFTLHGVDPFASLRVYLRDWRFNAPLFDLLAKSGLSESVLRALPFAILGVGALRSALLRREPLQQLPKLLFLFLLFSPTVHPWYALWVLPWLGPRPHWGLWVFVGAMGLSYGVWWQVAQSEAWGLKTWQEGLIWGLVAVGWWAQRRRAPV